MRKIIDWYGLEGRLALIGWLGYMAWMVLFCVVHQMVMANSHIDFMSSIKWTFREWGFWILIAPTLVSSLGKTERSQRPWLNKIWVMGAALLIALLYRLALSLYSGELTLSKTVVMYAPQYFQLLLVMSMGWWVLRKGEQVYHATKQNSHKEEPVNLPKKLLVSTGSAEALIDIKDICAIQAAGNYVDIHTASDSYILRATLKNITELLPKEQFVRCHRSAIINTLSVKQLHPNPSGNGDVELMCGRRIPVAKSFRSAFKQSGLVTA